MLDDFLTQRKFTPFYGNGYVAWENKPLTNGGVRIIICDDIADIRCIHQRYQNTVDITEIESIVKQLIP